MATSEHVLYIATIAAGGGDIAFAMHVISAILEHGLHVQVAISAQAGVDPLDAASKLYEALKHFNVNVANLEGITAGIRIGTSSWECSLKWGPVASLSTYLRKRGESVSITTSGESDDKWRADSLRCVVQGPLRLFDSAKAAVQAIYGVERILPLLTVREFGQSWFCSSSTAGLLALAAVASVTPAMCADFCPLQVTLAEELTQMATSKVRPLLISAASAAFDTNVHIDLSAGCASGEIGVFKKHFAFSTAERKTPSASAGTEDQYYFVGYYRTANHSREFAHLVVRQLGAIVATAVGLPDAPHAHATTATVWLPVDSISIDAFTAGLRECTGASDIVVSHAADTHRTIRIALPNGARCVLSLIDIWSQKLAMHDFQTWIAGSDGCCVTGDASFNEALVANVPFLYSTEPHKQGVAAALAGLLGQQGTGLKGRQEVLPVYMPSSRESPLIDQIPAAEDSICMLLELLLRSTTTSGKA